MKTPSQPHSIVLLRRLGQAVSVAVAVRTQTILTSDFPLDVNNPDIGLSSSRSHKSLVCPRGQICCTDNSETSSDTPPRSALINSVTRGLFLSQYCEGKYSDFNTWCLSTGASCIPISSAESTCKLNLSSSSPEVLTDASDEWLSDAILNKEIEEDS